MVSNNLIPPLCTRDDTMVGTPKRGIFNVVSSTWYLQRGIFQQWVQDTALGHRASQYVAFFGSDDTLSRRDPNSWALREHLVQ
jgi:hypothetical protein